MFFTQEDYRKIEKWLLANGVKDTGFAGASLPLKGNETVAFVQDGKNVNVFLKDLIEQIFLLGVSDFLNVTDKYGESRISLTQAIQLIPCKSRKIGQVITFLDEDGEWKLFQFQGERVNQWNNATLWVDLIKRIQGISITDSEDITATVDNLNQTSLTFADKNYNTTDYSGLGRVYLRKNIQSAVNPNTGITYSTNLLTQDMLSKENTVYIIQYDYSLNYRTITIPEGCVLQFEGGSISTGTLSGNNTIITAEPYNIFKTIGFAGTFNIEKVIPEWFGAKGDNSTINTKPFQDAIDFAEFAATDVEFQSGDYVIDGTLYIRKQSRIHITGMGKYKTFIYLKTTSPVNSMIDINSPEVTTYYQFIRIKDLSLYVNNNADYGIYAPKLTASEIDSITIFGASNYALRIEYGWSNILYNCAFSRGTNGVCLYRSANAIMMRQCTFTDLSGVGLHMEAGNAISVMDCDFEFVKGVPIYIKNRVTNLTVNGCYFEGNNETGFDFTNVVFNVKTSIIINGSAISADTSFGDTYKNESIVITNNYFKEWFTNSIVFAASVIGLNIRDNCFLKEDKDCYIFDAPIWDNAVTLEQVQIGNNPMFSGNFISPPETQSYLTACDIRVGNAIRKNYLPSIMSWVKSNSSLIFSGKYTDKYNGLNTFELQQSDPASIYYSINTTELAGKWIQFRCKYKTLSPDVNLHMGISFADKSINIGNTSLIATPSDWLDRSAYLYIPEGVTEINVSFRIYSSFQNTPVSVAMTQPILAEIGTIYEDYFGDTDFNKIITQYLDPIFGSGWENGDIVYVRNKGIIYGTPYLIYKDGAWYNFDATLSDKVTII
nr:MAG TPA: Right handed beta helix region [Crassvirales sp.]